MVARRALSFPSVLDGTVHVMSPLSSTHALQERLGGSSRVTRGLKLRPAQVSFTTAGAPYCSRACTDGPKSIIFNGTPSARDARPTKTGATCVASETRFVWRRLERKLRSERFLSIAPGSSIVATPRNVLRTKLVTREPAANRRRNTKRKASKTRALELAQEKQAVDVPREQRDQDEDDAV